MAKKFIRNAIGIEITEESIFLTQMDYSDPIVANTEGSPIVTKVKTISIPPRTITDGQLTDPDTVSEQIASILSEDEFSSENIIIALNHFSFFKRLEKLPIQELSDETIYLESEVEKNTYFHQKEFHIGKQMYTPEIKKEELTKEEAVETMYDLSQEDSKDKGEPKKNWHAMLYAALPNELIENFTELSKSLDKNLVSVDLVPLGALRAILWGTKNTDDPTIICFIDNTYIDFNVVHKQHVLLSHVFRRDITEILDEDFFVDTYIGTIKQLLCHFSNLYPQLELPKKCYYFSRVPRIDAFIQRFHTDLLIDIEEYNVGNNISFIVDDLAKDKLENYGRSYLPSIGLALKFFEPTNKTLSITKVKKQLAPIFNQQYLIIFAAIFGVLLVIVLGITFYFKSKTNSIDSDLNTVKNRIQSIQTGEFVGRQKKIDTFKNSIKYFGQIKEQDQSSYLFFYELIELLPADITFLSFKLSEKDTEKMIFISCQSYFQDSIYTLYNTLKTRFQSVNLTNIKTRYDEEGLGVNQFQVNFTWTAP